MKKRVFLGIKTIAVALFLAVLLTISATLTALANEQDTFYCISQSFYGDPHTQKGLCWTTDTSITRSDVQIVLKDDSQPDFSNPLAEYTGTLQTIQTNIGERNFHKALVTDLEPGKEYYYRVGDKEKDVWSDAGIIKTEPENSDRFSALIFSDSQFWDMATEAQYGANTQIAAFSQYPEAAFAINCGDMMDSGQDEAQWEEIFKLGKSYFSNYTYMPVTGNHDSGSNAVFNHFNLLPAENSSTESGVYYSFDYGNVHFIIVNSNETSDEYMLSQQQRDWIIADAAASDKTFKVLCVHHPIYSGRSDPLQIATYRSYFSKLITEAGIDFVFQGHTHCWSRTYPLVDTEGSPTQVLPENKYSGTINGYSYSISDNPGGTYYLTLAMAGPKQNGTNENSQSIAHLLAVDKAAGPNNDVGAFVRIDVEKNKMGVTCYNHSNKFGITSVSDSFAIIKGEEQITKGDVNGDGRITSVDSLWVLRFVSKRNEPTEIQAQSADVNNDGKISSMDALWILQHITGSRPSL